MKLEDFIDEEHYRRFLSDVLISKNNIVSACNEYNDLFFNITANKSKRSIYYEYTLSYSVSKSLVIVEVNDVSPSAPNYRGVCSIFDKMLKDLISGMEQLVIDLPKEIKKFSK